MLGYFEILCGIAAILVGLYYYLTSPLNFWEKRGIKGPKPTSLLIGNFGDVNSQRLNPGVVLKNVYDQFPDEPMVGIYARTTPLLILKNPDHIKDVLIKDFSKFPARGIPLHEKAEPLSVHLLALEPKRWRPLRSKLSPAFTPGRLKDMFALTLQCSQNLEKYLEKLAAKGESVDVRELTAKFTTDVIGTCAFGIEMKAMDEENNQFREMGKRIFKPTGTISTIRARLRQAAPGLYDVIGPWLPQSEMTKFFTSLVVDTMNYRREHNVVRNDFIDALVDLQNHPEKLGDIEVNIPLLASQAFLFFAAGFETSSTTISNALYELAMHQDIQDKVREEIKETFKKNNGDLQYETIKEMKYLDMVFRETLRKYPPGTLLSRQAMTDYTFEGTKLNIPSGTRIWIPVYALHRDPKIYPDPDKFDPERFTEEEEAKRHPMTYLPFGYGPRNCIGARFAVYQTKVGILKVLHHYRVSVCKETPKVYENDPASFILAPIGGLPLLITKADELK